MKERKNSYRITDRKREFREAAESLSERDEENFWITMGTFFKDDLVAVGVAGEVIASGKDRGRIEEFAKGQGYTKGGTVYKSKPTRHERKFKGYK